MNRFVRPSPSTSVAKKNGLAPFAVLNERGREWAEAGSRLVLANVDKPSLHTVRACEILGLYWFAVGEMDRVAIHSS